MAALHLATRVFLAESHVSDEQRDKEQERARQKRRRNLTNLSKEILERSRGRRRRENFNEIQRKAERNRARDKTVIYNGCLSGNAFLLNICLVRCLTYFVKPAKKTKKP